MSQRIHTRLASKFCTCIDIDAIKGLTEEVSIKRGDNAEGKVLRLNLSERTGIDLDRAQSRHKEIPSEATASSSYSVVNRTEKQRSLLLTIGWWSCPFAFNTAVAPVNAFAGSCIGYSTLPSFFDHLQPVQLFGLLAGSSTWPHFHLAASCAE